MSVLVISFFLIRLITFAVDFFVFIVTKLL